jgi:N-acetylmuramoyl-L-alanine amidase
MRVRAFLLAVAVMAVLPATAAADFPHIVEPGETLTSVAAVDGLSIAAIAEANHISPNAELIIGQVLWIPPQTTTAYATQGPTAQSSTTETTAGSDQAASNAPTAQPPYPTAERVSAGEIAYIAEANGVPPSLAEAISWQESGWNNDVVSSVGAVGAMQIVPSVWGWINTYLTPTDPLGPASAAENVRGGVLLLHDLLESTGDNYALTAAAYFQGLASVRKHGMYPDTRQYVADILALQQRFGG